MEAIEALVAQIDQFPTLPHVATSALAELEREDCDFEEIASLISLDPVLVGRVLRLANSAFFGAAKRSECVVEAMTRLGTHEVRCCLLTVAVMEAIPELPSPHSAKRFWTLSLASALVAQHVARELASAAQSRAYVAGLVHLVGEAVLAVQFTERYRRAIGVAERDAMPLEAALAEEFGCDHASLGARVLEVWQFAPSVIRAVRRQAAPDHAGPEAELASLILAADGICRELGLGIPGAGAQPDWRPRLAAPVLAAMREASGSVGDYLAGLREPATELIDFALTVF